MVNHLKKIIPFLIITILATGGVETFYRMTFNRLMQVSSSPKMQARVTQVAAPISGVEKKRPDYQVILKRNLFGPPQGVTPATTEQDDTPAATALELTLIGTITGPPHARRAIILDKKKKVQDIYKQGDTIDGAVIKEIQRRKVTLNVNGKDEILVPEIPKTNPTAPAEGAVEPEPIITTETPEPAESSPAQQNNLPNINKRPNMNTNQDKP